MGRDRRVVRRSVPEVPPVGDDAEIIGRARRVERDAVAQVGDRWGGPRDRARRGIRRDVRCIDGNRRRARRGVPAVGRVERVPPVRPGGERRVECVDRTLRVVPRLPPPTGEKQGRRPIRGSRRLLQGNLDARWRVAVRVRIRDAVRERRPRRAGLRVQPVVPVGRFARPRQRRRSVRRRRAGSDHRNVPAAVVTRIIRTGGRREVGRLRAPVQIHVSGRVERDPVKFVVIGSAKERGVGDPAARRVQLGQEPVRAAPVVRGIERIAGDREIRGIRGAPDKNRSGAPDHRGHTHLVP